jgi:phosphoenolpyruvate synthase/pyruvate phosphate dikinase
LGSHNLREAFLEFKKDFDFVNIHYSISPWWALEAWQYDFLKIISKLVEKHKLQNQYEKIIASLLKPWKTTAISEVGRKVTAGVSVNKLVKQFQFLRTWTLIWYKPITPAWIKSSAGNPAQKQKLFTFTELLKLLKPSQNEKSYFVQAPYISFFKDWRDDLRRRHAYEWNFLFVAMASHFKVDEKDLGYFTLDELSEALQTNKLDIKLIRERKGKEFILTVPPQSLLAQIIPRVPIKYNKAIREAESINKEGVVRGIIAQIGIVRGRVRIVHNHHDIRKIGSKEILIANTTHPDYLQGMKKAAGFVTDEGGIVSHAAIVAREFKKPCIVGTKIATKIFKDGDMVEVDANKGIVKKITNY